MWHSAGKTYIREYISRVRAKNEQPSESVIMPGNCTFNELWLEKEEFKSWLRKDPLKCKGYCVYCKKTIDVSAMGESALRSHAKGKCFLFFCLLWYIDSV